MASEEVKQQRKVSDAIMAERHKEFDLSAKDNHPKSERYRFAVVTASAAYREGWERIFGKANSG